MCIRARPTTSQQPSAMRASPWPPSASSSTHSSPSRRQHRITTIIAHQLHHHHRGQRQRHPRQDLEHNAITTPSQHPYHRHGRHGHRDIIVAATIISITSSPSPSLPTCLASQAPLSSPTTTIIDIDTDMVAITTATSQAAASTPLPSTP